MTTANPDPDCNTGITTTTVFFASQVFASTSTTYKGPVYPGYIPSPPIVPPAPPAPPNPPPVPPRPPLPPRPPGPYPRPGPYPTVGPYPTKDPYPTKYPDYNPNPGRKGLHPPYPGPPGSRPNYRSRNRKCSSKNSTKPYRSIRKNDVNDETDGGDEEEEKEKGDVNENPMDFSLVSKLMNLPGIGILLPQNTHQQPKSNGFLSRMKEFSNGHEVDTL
ncbi:uncharacterized protein LOC132564387 [Ylistrum balloti]|uniref:uncharacterized protein LOC132564387 n=1 Tax=Ylistrum balloti TaxID=509963 RepID=UPI002905872D|nr:uncharacterized protein LOC132564387 [Ylistrum balloti]